MVFDMDMLISNDMIELNRMLDDIRFIKILLYLDKYNPNVIIGELENNLSINNTDVQSIIDSLIRIGIVVSENEKFRLTDYGRMIVNNLKTI